MSTQKPATIATSDWNEWVIGSGVSPEITALNVRSVTEKEAETLVNWKKYDKGEGWFVQGIDPATGRKALSENNKPYGQFKPLRPIEMNGKSQKYISPKGEAVQPIFLESPDTNYWQDLLKQENRVFGIGEGAKKSGAVMSLGIPSIALLGVWNFQKEKRILDSILQFCSNGSNQILLHFDMDLYDNDKVLAALKHLASEIKRVNSRNQIKIVTWDKQYKGIDDLRVTLGDVAVYDAIDNAVDCDEFIREIEREKEIAKNAILHDHRLLVETFGDSLKLNELKLRIELNGKTLPMTGIKERLMLTYGLETKSCESSLINIVVQTAEKNAYNPVKDYLDMCYEKHGDNRDLLWDIAGRYFGTKDPIHTIYLIRYLMGAAARVYEPGCKHDVALILQGKQGCRKTTFFETIAGKSNFDTWSPADTKKDDIMKLQITWFTEWGEFESAYKTQDISQIKAFLSTSSDNIRPPYGKDVEEMPRKGVICGSTNKDEFLRDETGNRRFLIIPVSVDKIDLEMVAAERDKVWGAIIALYKQGFQYFLTDEEEKYSASVTKKYETDDVWSEKVLGWLNDFQGDTFTTAFILDVVLQIPTAQQNKSLEMRIADILKKAGVEKTQKRINGKLTRCWKHPEPSQQLQPFEEVVTGVEMSGILARTGFWSSVPTIQPEITPKVSEV
ncbi:MAG: VapE domain-containing protein, partial [Waterburya sp.]